MEKFAEVYARLNAAQREAVDAVYGPLLVIAGPGTGKTQLLSARVAHILEVTDALPQNILCLTFTENGALNMRERLARFIGPHAYDVTISTYHGFGSSIIGRFPEYFTDIRLERPIDTLDKHELLESLMADVDYRSPIKQVRHHLGDLVSTISEVKRALLTPDDLRRTAAENLRILAAAAPHIADTLAPYEARMPGKLAVALPLWQDILSVISENGKQRTENSTPNLASLATSELEKALADAEAANSTKPLTAWKNDWLMKDSKGHFILKGTLEARRVSALADVLEAYDAALRERGLYDFDDMILEAIRVLETNNELRFTLQEQYQFILLDEFQDTNRAQLRLVQLLTDNPVHEGKPNVMAVGDDDQAIYAFQGAMVSNMRDYHDMYRDMRVITLTENYRSTAAILDTASRISAQIESRLSDSFSTVSKTLTAKADLPATVLQRTEYLSEIAERQGIATQVKSLIGQGVKPSEIAVLAPKHRYLEPLVPYLQAKGVPVRYEKRENILESPRVHELITMARLVLALAGNQPGTASSLWPEVLSYEFWDFSVADIWKLSWQAHDEHKSWSELLLDSPQFRHAALLVLTLAGKAGAAPAEELLDALIGRSDVQTHDRANPSVRSPFYDYYMRTLGQPSMYETATELSVLREQFRAHMTSHTAHIHLADLIAFVDAYDSAEQPMLNTSPYNQAEDSVQLLTVYKAKGLEYDHVFIIDTEDDVWGSRASGSGNKLTLPRNLAWVRHAGASEDEKLRAFFVALTRARYGLHLTSHRANYAGKQTERIKYLDEIEEQGTVLARNLPEGHQTVVPDESTAVDLATVETNWLSRHIAPDSSLKDLLAERLDAYQLSPTHLTKFIDLEYGGPESFLVDVLLKFPGAPTVDSLYGNAVHEALQWWQNQVNLTSGKPTISGAIAIAEEYIAHAPFDTAERSRQQRRAATTLQTYLAAKGNSYQKGNKAEKNFRSEGVTLDGTAAHLGGKIDLLEVDDARREIVVVDYKTTAKLAISWKPLTLSLHKYQLQLYAYKLLVEGSHTYAGYTVPRGKIVFTEPDDDGEFHELTLEFDQAETERVRQLLVALWHRVKTLNFPDTADYKPTLTDIRRFEDDLLGE